MKSLQDQVKEICRLADEVIDHPNLPVKISAKNIGVGAAIIAFAGGLPLPILPFILPLGPFGPLLVGGYILKKKMEKEKAQQEKERMLREIIKKQQAVIRELERRQANNAEEIKNLKRMLKMLEEMEGVVNKVA